MQPFNGGWFIEIKCEYCECEDREEGNNGDGSEELFLEGLKDRKCFDCDRTASGVVEVDREV